MHLFTIQYKLVGDNRLHSRHYRAITEPIALEMFDETIKDGSLSGEHPEIINVIKSTPSNFKKNPQNTA